MNTAIGKELTPRKIFVFWAPLAATWLMMAVEGPFLAAIIARLPEAKFNLAAYGVAFSIALLTEAPIMMLMSAATALVKDYAAYRKLRLFTHLLNGAVTALMLVCVWPSVFYYLTMDLVGLPRNVAELTHYATVILLPWPAAIGYRRFYQGILIRHNRTRRVAYGTMVRLCTMMATALIVWHTTKLPGAVVGAIALSCGVVAEAIAARLMAHGSLLHLRAGEASDEAALTLRFIIKFYFPLALTTIIALGSHPMVTFFMGQARMPLESLAVLPVINALAFIFRSLGLSYMEVVVALLGEKNEALRPLRNFAAILGLSVVAGLALIAFTPMATVWFHQISGLSVELAEFARIPTQLLVLIPGLSVLLSFQRAIMVNARWTTPVTIATMLEVGGIATTLTIGILIFNGVGAVVATMAYVLGRLCANTFLGWANWRVLRGQIVAS